jgi:NAD+ diphosphatase
MFLSFTDPPGESSGPCLVVAVRRDQVAILERAAPDNGIFLGTLADQHCWAIDLDEAASAGGRSESDDLDDIVPVDLRRLWGSIDETTWTLAGRALQLVEWARTHRYCGRCGDATDPVSGERARRCPSCGLLAFPRLAPAMIVLVERENGAALLARGAAFPVPMYSCLAGFVEPGETLEEAVMREVREEVGLQVEDVRYFGSQPWPFPHSLMIGFTAKYGSGELALDEREILDAGWYQPDELPMIPPVMSIARRLIDDWVARSKSPSRPGDGS